MSETKNKRLSSNPVALKLLKECVKQNLPDKKIQERLVQECGYKWTLKTIGRLRRKMGVIRKPGKVVDVEAVDSPMTSIAPHGMTETEKANWFRGQFKKTYMYITIKRQFEPDEVAVYLEDFGLLCCQFEDIVISEFMQIDDFIKHRILVNQQLISKRSLQRQIDELQMWLIEHPKVDGEDVENAKERTRYHVQLDKKYQYLKSGNDRYDSLVKERQKIYNSLAATRKDRLDELRGGKETFLELVGILQHSQEDRDRQGRFAELTKLAADDIKDKFRKPVEFPDGSQSPIIMDSETDFGVDDDE